MACNSLGVDLFLLCWSQVGGKSYSPLHACPSPKCKQDQTAGKLMQQTRGSKFVRYQDIKIQELVRSLLLHSAVS